jgi:hypothetical protein
LAASQSQRTDNIVDGAGDGVGETAKEAEELVLIVVTRISDGQAIEATEGIMEQRRNGPEEIKALRSSLTPGETTSSDSEQSVVW